MSLEQVKKDILNKQIPPLYLWYGDDRYSLVEGLKLLKEFFQTEDASGTGIELLAGKDVNPSDIVDRANTASFFSRRLVIVDDIPYFDQKTKVAEINDENDDADIEETLNLDILIEYCHDPNPGTCLVLVSEKVNRGRKLYKAFAKAGSVIAFNYPRENQEWIDWIQQEALVCKKVIKSNTASYFLECVGKHTGILRQELDKLSLYIGKSSEITKQDIDAVCITLIETKVFAVVDAIAARNTNQAIQRLTEVLTLEHPMKINTMIVRQIRLLLAGSILRKRGKTAKELMEVMGIRTPYEGNKIFKQAARFSPDKLALAMEVCLQTELALKNSGGDPHFMLEMMVIRLCQ